MLCQWWLLGVRNKAHDNVPSWVPLCSHISHNSALIYSPKASSAIFLWFTIPALTTLLYFYRIIFKKNKGVNMNLYVSVHKEEQKAGEYLHPSAEFIFPSIVPPWYFKQCSLCQGEVVWKSRKKKRMNWHKGSFGCLIFVPFAFEMKGHERRQNIIKWLGCFKVQGQFLSWLTLLAEGLAILTPTLLFSMAVYST